MSCLDKMTQVAALIDMIVHDAQTIETIEENDVHRRVWSEICERSMHVRAELGLNHQRLYGNSMAERKEGAQ